MEYGEALDYFLNIPMFAREKHRPDKLREFLETLGNPDREINIIHVAGTNGKGSVCAFLESVFRIRHGSTAMFTSPHLVDVRERFRFDGRMVSEEEFLGAFLEVYHAAEALGKRGVTHPTFFEFAFLMFLVLCKEKRPGTVILETGMGGRLDATNVIERPAMTIITSVSLDHMQYLGGTVREIAGEKAGIIKPGVPVVCDGNCEDALEVIRARAALLGSPVYAVDRTWYNVENTGEAPMTVTAACGLFSSPLLVPSVAGYQAENAVIAAEAAQLLGAPAEAVKEGIANMAWPGRMEQAAQGFYLDGAHNADGIRAFARAASLLCERRRQRESRGGRAGNVRLVFAVSSDKEHLAMLRELCRAVPMDCLYITQVHGNRRLKAEELFKEAREAAGCRVREFDTVREALGCALADHDGAAGDLLFAVGSLYLVGEIKEELSRIEERA